MQVTHEVILIHDFQPPLILPGKTEFIFQPPMNMGILLKKNFFSDAMEEF
ncbi:hypothetical protein ES703_122523 [subsurface metagenome]